MSRLDSGVFTEGFDGLLNAHMKSLTQEKKDWWFEQLSDSDDTAFIKAMWKLRDKDRFPGWKEIRFEISQYTAKVVAEERGFCHGACINGSVMARVWYDKPGTIEPSDMAFNCSKCSRDKTDMRNLDPHLLVFDDFVHQWKDKKSMAWDHANIYNVEGRYRQWDFEAGKRWLKRMEDNCDKNMGRFNPDQLVASIVGPKHPDHDSREAVRQARIEDVEKCEKD